MIWQHVIVANLHPAVEATKRIAGGRRVRVAERIARISPTPPEAAADVHARPVVIREFCEFVTLRRRLGEGRRRQTSEKYRQRATCSSQVGKVSHALNFLSPPISWLHPSMPVHLLETRDSSSDSEKMPEARRVDNRASIPRNLPD
jgi:hypothetical protein